MIRLMMVLLLIAAWPMATEGQREPRRPRLPEAADTNSAMAYYQWGMSRIRNDPGKAADAFYWATKLVPQWAAPLYARRVAMLLEEPRRLIGYMERNRRVMRNREIKSIDSLELRARQLDPFIHRTLDWVMVRAYLTESTMESLRRRYGSASVEELRTEVEYYIDGVLQGPGGAQWRAWRAYSNGQMQEALDQYAESLRRADEDEVSSIHLTRGQVFYLMQQNDSACAELNHALELSREKDEDDLVFVYESKAMLEYSIGMALEASGKLDEAREAYGRALMEDMAFYAAHVQMGALALAEGDTLMALTEYGMAVEVEPELPHLRAILGELLFQTGQHAEAAEQFQQAIELDPYYAEPFLMLASAHEELGNTDDAITCYRDFLAKAMANDDRRALVEQKLGTLGGVP